MQQVDLADHRPLHVIIDSTSLKIYGAGHWLEEKHGVKSRRQWRKLHIGIDADNGDILAEVLTDQNTSDIGQIEPLLDQIDAPIGCFMADGAYDGDLAYGKIRQHSPNADIIIPPPSNAVPKQIYGPHDRRDWHIRMIEDYGRLSWQKLTGYGKRSLVETAIGRYKSIIANKLRSRQFENQKTEAALACNILNRMLASARPKSVRVKATIT